MEKPKTRHMGRKVRKIRKFKGVKQEALALALGISQQAISQLEREEFITEARLKEIADALDITPEIIKNFEEEKIFYYINAVRTSWSMVGNGDAHNRVDLTDKLLEVYGRLLASEKEKVELLKKIGNGG